MSTIDYEQALIELEERLKNAQNLEESLEIKDRILELKANQGILSTPEAWNIECLGCGS